MTYRLIRRDGQERTLKEVGRIVEENGDQYFVGTLSDVTGEAGQALIGMIRPEPMLSMLSQDPELLAVAKQVEASTTEIIQAAAMIGPTTISPR